MPRSTNSLGNLAADGSTTAATFNFDMNGAVLVATGTFGSGTVTFEGSVDGTNWYTLLDGFDGTALTLTASGMARVAGDHPWVRATVAGSTTPDIDVSLNTIDDGLVVSRRWR